jgi:hypothetical protein
LFYAGRPSAPLTAPSSSPSRRPAHRITGMPIVRQAGIDHHQIGPVLFREIQGLNRRFRPTAGAVTPFFDQIQPDAPGDEWIVFSDDQADLFGHAATSGNPLTLWIEVQ